MAVLFSAFWCVLLIISLVYYILQRKFNYWKTRNVPYLTPLPFFGNYKDYVLMKVPSPIIAKKICEQFPDAPYVGVFYGTEPALIIKDMELLKLVTTKDFYYFNGREVTEHTHKEVITQNIFFTQGERWKVLRQNLTPLFSSNKIKNMFYLIKDTATELESLLDKEFQKSTTIDIRDISSRYTIDIITLCAFGMNSKAMGESKEINPFRIISEKVLEVSTFNGIKNCFRTLWPRIFYALGLKMFSSEVNNFFSNLLKEVFTKRDYKPSTKHDFIDLILSLYQNKVITGEPFKNGDKKIEMEVNDDFLTAQCVAFFGGGFETTATTLHFVLYELAKHEYIQKLALADVDSYLLRHTDGVEYDVLNELPYLDACIDEAMRLHPLLGTLTREVMENYKLPDGLVLEKGLRIHIPVSYLHLNPVHFPNPEEYDPERFLGKNNNAINSFTYLPFGVGPRLCIGSRFAKLVLLTALVAILKKYSVKLADGTPRKVHYEPRAITTVPVEKIWLTLVPRN